jgi:arylsulfatase A-like enzyme
MSGEPRRASETAAALLAAVGCVVAVAVAALRARPSDRQEVVRLLERCLEADARFEWSADVVPDRIVATTHEWKFPGEVAGTPLPPGWLLLDEELRLVSGDVPATRPWRPSALAGGGEEGQDVLRFPTGRGGIAIVVAAAPARLLRVRARLRRSAPAHALTAEQERGEGVLGVVPLKAPVDLAAALAGKSLLEVHADPLVSVDPTSLWTSRNAAGHDRWDAISLSFLTPRSTQALLLTFAAGEGAGGAPLDLESIVLEEWTLRAFAELGAPPRNDVGAPGTAPMDPRELPLLPPADPARPGLRKVEDLLERRDALVLPPPARASFEVELPTGDLVLEYGVTRVHEPRRLWARRPIDVSLRVEPVDGGGAAITREERLEPDGPGGWQDRSLDLGVLAGRRVRFAFATTTQGSIDVAAIGAPIVRRRAPRDRRPSIVLVSLDTVRADHLSCNGYPRPTTPSLDSLARASAWFRDASSTSSYTLPAHGSLLTGQWPSRHGAESERPGRDRLGRDRSDLLAARLHDAGWCTAAFTGGAYLAPNFGFDQGFDLYDTTDLALEPDDERARRLPVPGDQEFNERHRKSRTLDTALSWIRAHRDGPFLLFLHTYLVHNYLADAEDDARFHGSCTSSVARGDLGFVRDRSRKDRPAAADLDHFVDAYDAALHQADEEVGRLLAALRALGLDDSTIVVVVSDHGEEFGDHGGVNHGRTLHEEVLRVPLLMRAPGLAPREIVEPVSLADVTPTLLELVGLAPEREMDGRSLVPLLRGEPVTPAAIEAELNLVKENRWAARRVGDRKALSALDERRPEVLEKLGEARGAARRLVFAPGVDPRETIDLAESAGEQAASAAALLDELEAQREAMVARRRASKRGLVGGAAASSATRSDLEQGGYAAPAEDDDD